MSVRQTARIADGVCVTGSQAEGFFDIESCVHAGHDGQAAQRRGRQRGPIERLRVTLALGEQARELAPIRHRRAGPDQAGGRWPPPKRSINSPMVSCP